MGAFKKTFNFVLDFQCVLYYTIFESKKEGVHAPLEASVQVRSKSARTGALFMYLSNIFNKCQRKVKYKK